MEKIPRKEIKELRKIKKIFNYKIEKLNPEEIKFMKKVARFFEKATEIIEH